jgi:hypothetical protein
MIAAAAEDESIPALPPSANSTSMSASDATTSTAGVSRERSSAERDAYLAMYQWHLSTFALTSLQDMLEKEKVRIKLKMIFGEGKTNLLSDLVHLWTTL